MAEVVVEGTVSRLHGRGTGFSVKEEWETRQGPMSRFWAVFPSEVQALAEGDQVRVRGEFRVKLSEPRSTDGRVFPDVSVSDAVVERAASPTPEAPAEEWPTVEPGWGASGYAEEAPF